MMFVMIQGDPGSLVSIIIPAYNREQYLAATIQSCRAQTHPFLEIIVVDDGSTDGTLEVAQKYSAKDSRIQIIRSQNHGLSAARNLGLTLSTGRWIKFLDSDDLLPSQTISVQLAAAREWNASIVSGGVIDFGDDELNRVRTDIDYETSDPPPKPEIFNSFFELDMVHPTTFNEVLIERSLVVALEGFDRRLRAAEETNLMFRISSSYPKHKAAYILEQPVLLKRLNPPTATKPQPKVIPWSLLSLHYATEHYIAQNGTSDSPLRRHLYNRLYQAIVTAYQDGQASYADKTWPLWRESGLPKPRITPWYHHWLHRFFTPKQAEYTLKYFRRARNRILRRKPKPAEAYSA